MRKDKMNLDKKETITNTIFGINLNYTEEDREKLNELISSYCRKQVGVSNSKIENISGGLLWVYSKVNFLWEEDNSWSRGSIAEKLGVKSKTIGNKATEIMKALGIGCFDARFARKNVADENPFNKFGMTSEGFMVLREEWDER